MARSAGLHQQVLGRIARPNPLYFEGAPAPWPFKPDPVGKQWAIIEAAWLEDNYIRVALRGPDHSVNQNLFLNWLLLDPPTDRKDTPTVPNLFLLTIIRARDSRVLRKFLTRAETLEEARTNFCKVNATEAAEGEPILLDEHSLTIEPVEWEHPIVEV